MQRLTECLRTFTLLWPWKPGPQTSAGDLAALSDIAAHTRPLQLRLTKLDTFPGVLWLRPEPLDDLLALMRQLWAHFPNYPPFGGSLPNEPIPHVTVAKARDNVLGGVAAEVQSRIGHRLPVRLDVSDIAVSVEGAAPDGRWAPVHRFSLGSA